MLPERSCHGLDSAPARQRGRNLAWQPRSANWSMRLTLTPSPKRGELWTADLGQPPARHWVLIVSLNPRNTSEKVNSLLVVPFGSSGLEGPTVLKLEPGETGLPGVSYLKGHFITTLPKSRLVARQPRALTERRMQQVVEIIHRAYDPDAPWNPEER
jgi:mRNA-degrading endonuclease toxin of MazEF toxin-antitoxin module